MWNLLQFKNQWKVVSLSVQTRLFSSTNGIYNRKAFTMTPCKTRCGSPHLFRESALVFWLLKGGSGSDRNCYSSYRRILSVLPADVHAACMDAAAHSSLLWCILLFLLCCVWMWLCEWQTNSYTMFVLWAKRFTSQTTITCESERLHNIP